ncbi:hypothetical protein CSAL01_05093 [Colletotrichum salicis]|uniref:Uncharacterized protein n=1 Tax=Colletotrichum salicis TaxID=1209931 RepID=A0A135RWM4_9PEZI|nr:hypothetical protein CSAL01_05093 [Colletotrichum salicis]
MGAADENTQALSTVTTKAGAETTIPTLDEAATLPFELVFIIMDHVVLYIESMDFLELSWEMKRDDSQALGVSFVLAEANLNPSDISHGHHFRRSMVLGKFYFLYPQMQEEKDVSNHVLINPKKDQFQVADSLAWDAIGHPRAALKPLVERMSKVFIGNGSFFASSNSNNIEILQSFPSLRRVDLEIGRKESLALESEHSEAGLVELEVGTGNWRIATFTAI